MRSFTYYRAESLGAAAKALAGMPGAMAKAGGTDLMDLLKERVVEPDALIDLPGTTAPAGALAAGTTLAALAADQRLARDFPAVQQAAAEAATPQIRNRATLGGNLAQVSRCWYIRTKGFDCYKLGVGGCAALKTDAETRYHAILGHSKCACAHPSNLAPALIAVDARVACTHPDGDRVLAASDLYRAPKRGQISDTALRPGELITHVQLTPSPLARNSIFLELRERQSFDFAVASVAAALHAEGGKVKAVRIAIGAIAPIPYRAATVEKALVGKPLDANTIGKAVEAAIPEAEPLGHNQYKVAIVRHLLRRALEQLA